jgi:F-type H+-transporting ATPase subunit g
MTITPNHSQLYRSVQAFQTYFNTALKHLRNPSALISSASASAAQAQPSNVLSQIRNVNRQQLAVVGVVAAEVLGFFTVGEMIGRFKLVGYRSSAPAHHD